MGSAAAEGRLYELRMRFADAEVWHTLLPLLGPSHLPSTPCGAVRLPSQALHVGLAQLSFAARQFLYLNSLDDGDDPAASADVFPEFDSEIIHVHPGVHLNEHLDNR